MLERFVLHYRAVGRIILYSVISLVVFLILMYQSIQKHVKENWSEYRSDPMMLPFAGFFNPPEDQSAWEFTKQNIIEVIWASVEKFLKILMTPIYPIMSMFLAILKQMTGSLNSIRTQMAVMRQFLFRLFDDMYVRLQNSTAAITFYFLKLREGLKRSYGLMELTLSTIEHSYIFLQSMVRSPLAAFGNAAEGIGMTAAIFAAGPAGISIWQRSLCFHPTTLIRMKDGSVQSIKHIQIGDRLEDGSIVQATVICQVSTPMYRLFDVIVSGDHKVKSKSNWIRVRDHPLALLVEYDDENVVCLITDTSVIPINGQWFRDYLDDPCPQKWKQQRHLTELYLNSSETYQSSDSRDYMGGLHPSIQVENKDQVVGKVVIGAEYLDVYELNGLSLGGNTLVFLQDKDIWVRVRDHPGSVYQGKNQEPFVHWITEVSTVLIHKKQRRKSRNEGDRLMIRDFCEVADHNFCHYLDQMMDE